MAKEKSKKKDKAETVSWSEILEKAFSHMATAKAMTDHFEANFKEVSKYVHATSRGHEAIQIALGMQLTPDDWLSAYYRDDAMMLSIGMQPYELMLQLMAKKDDPFSGARPPSAMRCGCAARRCRPPACRRFLRQE